MHNEIEWLVVSTSDPDTFVRVGAYAGRSENAHVQVTRAGDVGKIAVLGPDAIADLIRALRMVQKATDEWHEG